MINGAVLPATYCRFSLAKSSGERLRITARHPIVGLALRARCQADEGQHRVEAQTLQAGRGGPMLRA
jgi:hypothetical protein